MLFSLIGIAHCVVDLHQIVFVSLRQINHKTASGCGGDRPTYEVPQWT
jgi:hypothetical protein